MPHISSQIKALKMAWLFGMFTVDENWKHYIQSENNYSNIKYHDLLLKLKKETYGLKSW